MQWGGLASRKDLFFCLAKVSQTASDQILARPGFSRVDSVFRRCIVTSDRLQFKYVTFPMSALRSVQLNDLVPVFLVPVSLNFFQYQDETL